MTYAATRWHKCANNSGTICHQIHLQQLVISPSFARCSRSSPRILGCGETCECPAAPQSQRLHVVSTQTVARLRLYDHGGNWSRWSQKTLVEDQDKIFRTIMGTIGQSADRAQHSMQRTILDRQHAAKGKFARLLAASVDYGALKHVSGFTAHEHGAQTQEICR